MEAVKTSAVIAGLTAALEPSTLLDALSAAEGARDALQAAWDSGAMATFALDRAVKAEARAEAAERREGELREALRYLVTGMVAPAMLAGQSLAEAIGDVLDGALEDGMSDETFRALESALRPSPAPDEPTEGAEK